MTGHIVWCSFLLQIQSARGVSAMWVQVWRGVDWYKRTLDYWGPAQVHCCMAKNYLLKIRAARGVNEMRVPVQKGHEDTSAFRLLSSCAGPLLYGPVTLLGFSQFREWLNCKSQNEEKIVIQTHIRLMGSCTGPLLYSAEVPTWDPVSSGSEWNVSPSMKRNWH